MTIVVAGIVISAGAVVAVRQAGQGQGWIPASSTLGQIDYGAEIVSTDSAPATFAFTNFSISSS